MRFSFQPSSWKVRALTVSACAVLAVGTLAACSSSKSGGSTSSSSGAASSSASGSAAASPTGTPVEFGAIGSETGTGASGKPTNDGLAAFIAYANSTTGFGGRPGKLDRCDDMLDPQKATDCARNTVGNTAIIASTVSGRQAGVEIPEFEKAADPMPDVCGSANSPQELTSPIGFCLSAGSLFYNYLDMSYLKSKNSNFSKGYFITADSTAGHQTGAAAATLAQGLGLTLTQAYFPPAQTDFLPVAQAALAAKPDFLLIGAAPAQELSLLQALITLNSTVPLGTYSQLIPNANYPQIASAKFQIVMDAPFPDAATSTDPEVTLYRTWMSKEGYSSELGSGSLQGWVTGEVFQAAADAVKKSGGDLTRANILKSLRTGTFTNLPLLVSPLSLANAPKKTAGYNNLANATENVGTIQAGKYSFLTDTVTLP